MDVFNYFDKNTCNFLGKKGSDKWNWLEYYDNKKKIEDAGGTVVLVDMIDSPRENSVPISNELFNSGKYPDGTFFVLFCHSGGSSGYLQKQIKPQLPQYTIINMAGGIGAYQPQP